MPKVAINTPAPDFTLDDMHGNPVKLSNYRDQKHVLLVFNRGFA
jgi:peroxiredoxin